MPDHQIPSHLGFDYEFLVDRKFLPPFVEACDSPLFGTSRRLRREELSRVVTMQGRRNSRLGLRPHDVALTEFWGIFDHGSAPYNLLQPGRLLLSEQLLDRHLLLIGPPGAGKTTQMVLPLIASLLADNRRTVVVFDPKGDQYHTIRQLAAREGRRKGTMLLNLGDADAGLGWNPVREGLRRDEALAIATSLVLASENKASNDSPFWRNISIELITDVLIGLATDPYESPTLPRVLEVVQLPRPELLRWLREHGARRFAGFLESGSHNAETCLADTGMRLLALHDDQLCAVLSRGGLDLDRLFRTPSVLVIQASEARIDRYRPILNLLVQQLLDRAIAAADARGDGRLRFPVSVVIDEFASAIGTLPRMPVYLNTLRSRRVGVVAAVQSLGQLQGLYGADAGAVSVGFGSRIYFPGVTVEDAEAASRASGTMTVSRSAALHAPLPRPVYCTDEVRMPREHPVLGRPATLQLADMPTFQGYFVPSFRLAEFQRLVKFKTRRRRAAPAPSDTREQQMLLPLDTIREDVPDETDPS